MARRRALNRSPLIPSERRRRPSRRVRSLTLAATGALAAALGVLTWIVVNRGDPDPIAPQTGSAQPRAERRATGAVGRQLHPPQLVARRTSGLAQPIQDAAATALSDSRALLLGGLSAADTSTDTIRLLDASGERPAGRLPIALHDSAAVRLGRTVYLFGGGTGTRQLDQILRIEPASGGERASQPRAAHLDSSGGAWRSLGAAVSGRAASSRASDELQVGS
jgi:hypothetical protein